jgi:hypothetical protein
MKLTNSQKEKLKKHSTKHGGMMSKHIKNMQRFMRGGDSFAVAHKKAKALDKPAKKNNSSY